MHLWGGGGNKKQDKRQRQQSNSPEEQGSKKRTNLEDDFIMDVNKIMEKMDAQHKEVLTKHTEVFDRLNKIEGKCDINSQKAFAAIEELKREKSIVFYGFPETGTETLETQIAEVEKLLQKMGLNNPIIDDIFRMGKKTPTGKPRPLLVKMVRSIDKKFILQSGKKKLGKGDPIVERDKTQAERAVEKKFMEKFKELRAADKDIRMDIYKGKMTIKKNKTIIKTFTYDSTMDTIQQQ
ncbi:hypothetical protein Fcan01_21792 [Folsomia candida]|uniref:Uncharacterized protein n=1 Tax=Folsomia candida TaxID=158441 RepID=A0A226DEA6_FOLCA|nr:hypothetical protein Fcan01_21792 [Folsomia candida]